MFMPECCSCKKDVGIITIEIKDKNDSKFYCPNCICRLVYDNGESRKIWTKEEFDFEEDEDIIDDITNTSGAIIYKGCDEEYHLKKPVLMRLIRKNLSPMEYFKLVEKYGNDKYMLHDDFYDDATGMAIQPF